MIDNYTHELVKKSELLPVHFSHSTFDPITVPAHWHDYLELLYLQSGSMTAIIQGQPYSLCPGELLAVNSLEIHMTHTTEGSHYFLLQIPSALMQEYFPNFDQLHFQTLLQVCHDSKSLAKITDIFNQLFQSYHLKEDGYQLLFSAHLYTLLYHLYKQHTTLISPNIESPKRDFNRIAIIMGWINQHFHSPLTLTAAAHKLNISKEYLCRLFKKYMGQTFLEYLYTVRTMNVYEKLKKNDTPLTLLLEQSGITNYKIFMRTFKQLYGDTPRNIRKQFE